MTEGLGPMLSDRARNALCLAVTLAWIANIVASIFNNAYHPDPAINGIFSGMIGAVLAASSGKKDSGEKDPKE